LKNIQEIIYVHLGKRVPFSIVNSITNTKQHFKNTKITVLTDNPKKFKMVGVQIVDTKNINLGNNHKDFKKFTKQDSKFRDGFWMKASQRLFVLEDYMNTCQLDYIIHLENDCLISFTEKDINMFGVLPDDILIPRESIKRAVLPIMIIKSRKTYIECLSEFNRVLLKHPEIDEMEIFAKLADSYKSITNLPVISSSNYLVGSVQKEVELLSNNFESVQGLFDPSIYGQYLFGQDPTNNRYIRRGGFRNLNTNISTELLKWSLKDDGEYLTVSASEDGVHYTKLNNLHVHGKYLVPLVSNNYNYYVKLINNVNNKIFTSKFAKELLMHNLIRDPKIVIELIYQWISFLKSKISFNFSPRT
jgi:hypothetical protein